MSKVTRNSEVVVNNSKLKSHGILGRVDCLGWGTARVILESGRTQWFSMFNLTRVTGSSPTIIPKPNPKVKVQRVLLYNTNTGWCKVYRNIDLAKRAAKHVVATQQFINIEVEV